MKLIAHLQQYTEACENINKQNAARKKCLNCRPDSDCWVFCTECCKQAGLEKSSHLAVSSRS